MGRADVDGAVRRYSPATAMTVTEADKVVAAKTLMTVTSTMPTVSATVTSPVAATVAATVSATVTPTVATTVPACKRRSGDGQGAGSECDSRDSSEFLDLHHGRLLDWAGRPSRCHKIRGKRVRYRAM